MKVKHKLAADSQPFTSMTLGHWHAHYRPSKRYLNYKFWDVEPIYEMHEVDPLTGETTFIKCDILYALIPIVKRQPHDFVIIEHQGDKLDQFLMPVDPIDSLELQENRSQKIVRKFNTEYVKNQIRLMNESILEKPDTAIGTAKELIETCCMEILLKNNIEINKDWNLAQIFKMADKQIDFFPKDSENSEKNNLAMKKLTIGFRNIIHGISELRNNFGTGHGKPPEFKYLQTAYVRLIVASASELVLFYKSISDDKNNIN